MKSSFDMWLLTQADEYYSDCEPKVISVDYEPQDGELIKNYTMNCHECDNKKCEHWEEFNN